MRKIFIALLLVISMLFVSCSPENKKAENTKNPEETTAPLAPTAENFLKLYFTYSKLSEIASDLNGDLGSSAAFTLSSIDKDAVCKDLTYGLTVNDKKRYKVTSIVDASGTFNDTRDVSNISFTFKYYEETYNDSTKEFAHDESAKEKTGYLKFSFKIAEEATIQSVAGIACNFELPTRDAYFNELPDVSKSSVTDYGSFSFIYTDGNLSGLTVNGEKLSDADFSKAISQMGF